MIEVTRRIGDIMITPDGIAKITDVIDQHNAEIVWTHYDGQSYKMACVSSYTLERYISRALDAETVITFAE